MGLDVSARDERFRHGFDYLRRAADVRPVFENPYGRFNGTVDVPPKPVGKRLPLLVTGSSRQDPDWIARNADGWMTYPRSMSAQARVIADWQTRVAVMDHAPKPVLQPLYIDLADDPDESPQPIHLGVRAGVRALTDHLRALERIGVNHVALNLRFNRADTETTLKRLADNVLPHFAH